MDKKFISKSHNWFILNRTLVKNLCFDKDDYLIKNYKTIYAPAEYFYYTFIKILNLENEIEDLKTTVPLRKTNYYTY
jgi:hypothetical protein